MFLNLISGEHWVIPIHRPGMTSDDFDTQLVIYNVFMGAELESGIYFTLNIYPEAQTP